MREVLFRGKSVVSGEWREGYYVALDNKHHWIYSSKKYFGVVPETVGQYTGRNVGADKLFEGDIIEWQEDYDDLWGDSKSYTGHSIVTWDSDNSCWSLKTDTYIQPFNDFTWDRCYVVGNIHDNPELLKGEGQ